MIYTITISISVLIAINFLLLKFSCNKTNRKQKENKRPVVLSERITIVSESQELAPTGS